MANTKNGGGGVSIVVYGIDYGFGCVGTVCCCYVYSLKGVLRWESRDMKCESLQIVLRVMMSNWKLIRGSGILLIMLMRGMCSSLKIILVVWLGLCDK